MARSRQCSYNPIQYRAWINWCVQFNLCILFLDGVVYHYCTCTLVGCISLSYVYLRWLCITIVCVLTLVVYHYCMCTYAGCVSLLYVYLRWLCITIVCVLTLAVYHYCMCTYAGCVSLLYVYLRITIVCVLTLVVYHYCMCTVYHYCMCTYAGCVSLLYVYLRWLCITIVCVLTLVVYHYCMCTYADSLSRNVLAHGFISIFRWRIFLHWYDVTAMKVVMRSEKRKWRQSWEAPFRVVITICAMYFCIDFSTTYGNI